MTSGQSLRGPDDEADFAAPYELMYRQGARMTPRMAYWLCRTCVYLADSWRDHRDDPSPFSTSFPHSHGRSRMASSSTASPTSAGSAAVSLTIALSSQRSAAESSSALASTHLACEQRVVE